MDNGAVKFIQTELKFQGKPIALFEYQKHIANEVNMFSDAWTMLKARQVGGSFLVALLIVYYACCYSRSGFFIVSKTKDQSSLIYNYVNDAIKSSAKLRQLIRKDVSTKNDLQLKNGSRILFRSAGMLKSDTLRGWSIGMIAERGAVILDEAQFIPDESIEVADFASAGGHGLCAISTPKRPGSTFHRYCLSDNFKHYHIPARLCPRFTEDEMKRWKATKKKSVYRCECLAEFAPGEDAVFRPEDVDAAIDESLAAWGAPARGNPNANYHYSLDVSYLENDRTVLTILERGNDINRVVAHDSWAGKQNRDLENTRFTDDPDSIIRDILKWTKEFHCTKLYVDTTSNPYFAKALLKAGLPVEEIKWSTTSKERMITHLECCLRSGRLKIPKSDEMISELYNYSYDLKKMQDSETKILYLGGNADDHVCSLAMLATSIQMKIRNHKDILIWN